MADYERTQCVEITLGDWCYEAAFTIGLDCTSRSYPGSRIDPPEGAEFDISYVSLDVAKVNPRKGDPKFEKPLDLTISQFMALVGEEISNQLCDDAIQEAHESGRF